jgi:hypothetical protein
MEQPGRMGRRAAARRWALFAVVAALAAPATSARAEERGGTAPVGLTAAPVSFFIHRRLPAEFRSSVDEARRRLLDSRCAEVLTDFEDVQGRRLDLKVADLHHTAASYLSLVLFYDGRPTEGCEFSKILAWTNTGSRAVHVCANQFLSEQRRSLGFTANTLIHEMLHTLGLGENPPASQEITARVRSLCAP